MSGVDKISSGFPLRADETDNVDRRQVDIKVSSIALGVIVSLAMTLVVLEESIFGLSAAPFVMTFLGLAGLGCLFFAHVSRGSSKEPWSSNRIFLTRNRDYYENFFYRKQEGRNYQPCFRKELIEGVEKRQHAPVGRRISYLNGEVEERSFVGGRDLSIHAPVGGRN